MIKRILCIVDSYEWALYNRAIALKKYFNNVYFDIKHFNDLSNIDFNNYNTVYSLNWPIHGYINKKIHKRGTRRYRLVTGISSHIGQPKDSAFLMLLQQYDGVGTSNKLLYNDAKKKFPSLNVFYTPFGVDKDVFYPKTKTSDYKNIFGWVGNTTRDVKRLRDIQDVFSNLNDEIHLKVISQDDKLNRRQMAEFYNSIGTIICFSESEGTPNPILEAAACARNIISTNVGNVQELVRGSNTISVVKTKLELQKAIINNYNSPMIIDSNGLFLKGRVDEYWDWDLRARDFSNLLGIK